MKGLLLKDFYTVFKQMKVFLVLIIVFACLPGYSMFTFAIVYSAMLPFTALAYDERSKWDKLAAMMPYSPREIVLGKYVLGYIMIVFSSVFSILIQLIINQLINHEASSTSAIQIALAICVALVFESINLPIMIKLGVEKGRAVFIGAMAIIAFGIAYFGSELGNLNTPSQYDFKTITIVAILCAIILNVLSIALSIRFYKNKAE